MTATSSPLLKGSAEIPEFLDGPSPCRTITMPAWRSNTRRGRRKHPHIHGIRQAQRRGQAKALLWPWSRMAAFRRVQEVIAAAGIPDGPHACPKDLRHGFGGQAVSR